MRSSLQSGGPIATLRGEVVCTVPWDPEWYGAVADVAGGRWSRSHRQHTAARVALLAFDGTQWRDLGFDVAGIVLALEVFHGDLIVGGQFVLPTPGGSVLNLARRSGSSWLPLGHGFNGLVRAMTVFAGELVVGGSVSFAGGINAPIARWNSTWSSLGGVLTQGAAPGVGENFGSLYVGGA